MDSQLNIKAPKKKTVGTLDDILVSAMNVIEENAAENVPSSQVEDLIQDLTFARQASHEYVKKLKANLEDMHRDNYLLRKEISKLQIRLSMLREAPSADNHRACTPASTLSSSPNGGYEEEILIERPDLASMDISQIAENGESLLSLHSLTPLVEELRERPAPDNYYGVESVPGSSQHAAGPVTPSFGQAETN
ncbi:hypothetical protein HPB51_008200 [Rhipicephalus microplus]|uniref:Uncharacterized protein n=1 Tax=Rhipicephalus microplus TaxID=6941 RepID=A0A9J6EGG4_RHIMP|nr:hypothetical protein HPB51_008200 [Rhipicephalus microplus]